MTTPTFKSMTMRLFVAVTSILLLAPLPAAQSQQPAVRRLGEVIARSAEPMLLVSGVRALPEGRVLVNDASGRRVVMLDQSLAMVGVAADSTPSTANAYGPRPGSLVAYRGDSTLFIDAASLSMLVIDPAGKIVRVMSVPRSQDAGAIAGFGSAAFDARGRLVYRAMPTFTMRQAPGSGGPPAPPEMPDTAPLMRIDLATRQVDTVTFLKMPRISMRVTQTDDGRFNMRSVLNPLPIVDDWAMLSDGSIAVMRGRDYRLELISPEGTRASHRVPFEWQRLSDEDKVTFMDSVRVARERMVTEQAAAAPAGAAGGAGQRVMTPGGGQQITIFGGGPGGAGGGGQMRGAGGPPQLEFVDPGELPDHRPAFFANSIRADAEGNLWIRTTRTIEGDPIYDVINARGELVERVRLPSGRTLLGFGPEGAVYLGGREGTTAFVERASIR
jgi:hypothetical protein